MTEFVTDLFSNFWVSLAGKLLLVALMIPLVGMVIGFAEMKLSAKMQARVGPYFAGGRWGWAQLIADGVKFFQKEDLVPDEADRPVFKIAPVLVLVSTVALLVIIPFGPGLIFRDLEVGIFYALAISSLSTVGILMAGWSSGNKYSLMGGLRAAGQLIAYELPLVLAVIGIGHAGRDHEHEWDRRSPDRGRVSLRDPAIHRLRDLHDRRVGRVESDPVRYAHRRIRAGDGVSHRILRVPVPLLLPGRVRQHVLSLGDRGDSLPRRLLAAGDTRGRARLLPGPVILLGKTFLLVFAMIWFRWTFPRFREDQLQNLAWKVLIPLALANIILTGAFKVYL